MVPPKSHCDSSLAPGLNKVKPGNAPRRRRVRFVPDKSSQRKVFVRQHGEHSVVARELSIPVVVTQKYVSGKSNALHPRKVTVTPLLVGRAIATSVKIIFRRNSIMLLPCFCFRCTLAELSRILPRRGRFRHPLPLLSGPSVAHKYSEYVVQRSNNIVLLHLPVVPCRGVRACVFWVHNRRRHYVEHGRTGAEARHDKARHHALAVRHPHVSAHERARVPRYSKRKIYADRWGFEKQRCF